MKRLSDKILFEARSEIEELMEVIVNYVKQNPSEKSNDKLRRFYYLLEDMLFTW